MPKTSQTQAGLDRLTVLAKVLKDDGVFPNNRLPLLVYREAVSFWDGDAASAFEQLFSSNGWSGTWRNGIYPYHHYHSTAHEVLGIYHGSAKVQFGGEDGLELDVHPGDVLIIPAGVAHKNLGSTSDLGVVGGYPHGQDWDMNYGKPGERPRADRQIATVPLPTKDPAFGHHGPLLQHWKTRRSFQPR